MALHKFTLFFSVLTLFAIIHQGTCIQCIECVSSRDDSCGYPTKTNGAGTKTCLLTSDKCYHLDYNMDGVKGDKQYVQRGCVSKEAMVCPSVPDGSSTRYDCDFCEGDLCNTNPTLLKPIDDKNGNNGNNNGNGSGGSSSISPINIFLGFTMFVFFKNM